MPDGSLIGHTGMSPGPALRAFIDEEGNALLETPSGIGLLDDRDLHAFVGACRDVHDEIPSDKALLDAMAGGGGVLWQGLALESIKSCDVPGRFGFKPDPGP